MKNEITAFVINGMIATIVHFLALVFLVEIVLIQNLFYANPIAAIAGGMSSFIGNRYFVFEASSEEVLKKQIVKFILVYGGIMFLHTFIINMLSNWAGIDYRISFIFSLFFVLVISFLLNKFVVFNK